MINIKTLSGKQVCEEIIKKEYHYLMNNKYYYDIGGENIGIGNLSLPFQAYEWTEQNNKNKNKIIHRLFPF